MSGDPQEVAAQVRDLCQRTLVRRLEASERAEVELSDPDRRLGHSARERASLEAQVMSTGDVVRVFGEHEDRFGQPRRTHTHVKNEGLTPVLVRVDGDSWPAPIGGEGAAAPAGGAHGGG
jgi:hypothetical protein